MSFNLSYKKYETKFLYKDLDYKNYNVEKKYYPYFIIIPVYNELEYITHTLESINEQDQELLNHLLVILVINNSSMESKKIIDENYKTHQLIEKNKYNFEYIILDCYSKSQAINKKYFGVGLARKIGFDFAVQYSKKNSLFFSLDADTLISSTYLKTIINFYKDTMFHACTVNFKHQKSKDSLINKGIRIYEKQLLKIAKKIRSCNSPYGYVSMGSAIICTAEAYILIGGMPKRKAGEDFYFLQSLAKYTKIHFIDKILVHPSSRSEQRVHLGTGYRMKEFLETKKFNNLFFSDSTFYEIKKFISIATNNYKCSYRDLNKELIQNLGDNICNFLNENSFEKVWIKISLNSKTKKQFMVFFHQWFDALKIMQLLKRISE